MTDLGVLTKVKFQMNESDQLDNWFLYQMNITDLQTNDNYYFFPKHWLRAGEEVELPGTI